MSLQHRAYASLLALGLATALGGHASAGKVIDAAKGRLMFEDLGLRRMTPVQPSVHGEARKVEAQVVNPDRFSARGFAGAKNGDRVVVTVLDDARGRVSHEGSGKSIVFRAKADGTVERE